MLRLGDNRLTVAAFLLAIGMLLVMRQFFPASLASPIEGSKISPVLLLEFAASKQDLLHVFGDPPDAQRIAGMTAGNRLDYGLMLAYGLATLSFFWGVAYRLRAPVWRLAGWLGVAAAFSDAIENAIMFSMVADMTHPETEFAWLRWFVDAKFALLALSCAVAAVAFVKLRRWVLAPLCLPAPLLIIPGLVSPLAWAPLATSLIGLGWFAMLGHALTDGKPREDQFRK